MASSVLVSKFIYFLSKTTEVESYTYIKYENNINVDLIK